MDDLMNLSSGSMLVCAVLPTPLSADRTTGVICCTMSTWGAILQSGQREMDYAAAMSRMDGGTSRATRGAANRALREVRVGKLGGWMSVVGLWGATSIATRSAWPPSAANGRLIRATSL